MRTVVFMSLLSFVASACGRQVFQTSGRSEASSANLPFSRIPDLIPLRLTNGVGVASSGAQPASSGFRHGLGHQLEASASHFCSVVDQGVRCWGASDAGQIDVPADLRDVIAVSVGGAKSCALTATTVRCWGGGRVKDIPPPPFPLRHPKALKVANNEWDRWDDAHGVCVLDEVGVRCWASSGPSWWPPNPFTNVDADTHLLQGLENPQGFVDSSDGSLCAFGTNGVRCAIQGRYFLNTPQAVSQLKNPRSFTTRCALDDEGFKCFDPKTSSYETRVTIGDHPRSPVELKGFACVLVDKGVKCFMKDVPPAEQPPSVPLILSGTPLLEHPLALAASNTQACAIDDEGIHCWGASVPVFTHLRSLKSDLELNCGLDETSIRCWGTYMSHQNSFVISAPDGRPFDLFSIGGTSSPGAATGLTHVCATQGQSLSCWYGRSPKIVATLNVGTVRALASDVLDACVLTEKDVKCYEVSTMKPVWVSPPLQNPYLLKTQGPVLCAADDAGVHCYRLDGSSGDRYLPLPVPDGLTKLQDLSIYLRGGCILRESNVQCWDEKLERVDVDLPLKNAYILSAFISSINNHPWYNVCAADDDGLKCQSQSDRAVVSESYRSSVSGVSSLEARLGGLMFVSDEGYEDRDFYMGFALNSRVPSRVSLAPQSPALDRLKWWQLSAPYFSMGDFEADLDLYAASLYSPKSHFLRQIAAQIAKVPSEPAFDPDAGRLRYFYLKALEPFMREISTAYFQSSVTPRFLSSIEAYGRFFPYASLLEFPRDEQLKNTALSIVAIALTQSKSSLSDSDDRRRLELLITLAGESLSNSNQVAAFVSAYQQSQALFDHLKDSEETRAFVICVNYLVDFLE